MKRISQRANSAGWLLFTACLENRTKEKSRKTKTKARKRQAIQQFVASNMLLPYRPATLAPTLDMAPGKNGLALSSSLMRLSNALAPCSGHNRVEFSTLIKAKNLAIIETVCKGF